MRRRRRIASWAAGLLAAAMVSQAAWAQDPIHKARRGLVNVLTGWLEVPKQLQRARRDPSPLRGLGRGLFKGAGLTLLRGGVGLYELLTFPLPHPKDFASPYESMELPDYAWE